MEFTRAGGSLEQFRRKPRLSAEEVLGLFIDLCEDVKQETGSKAEACPVEAEDVFAARLGRSGKILLKLFEKNEALFQDEAVGRMLKKTEHKLLENQQLMEKSNQKREECRQRLKEQEEQEGWLADLEAECKRLEQEAEKRREREERLVEKRAGLKEMTGRVGSMEQEYEILCEAISRAKQKISELEADIMEHTPVEQRLKKEESRLVSQAAELKMTIAALEEQNPQLERRNAEEERKADRLREECRLLKETQRELRKRVEEQTRELNDFRDLENPQIEKRRKACKAKLR